MNWEVVATSAEVAGAVGVIASLIYVARQLHASQSAAADSNRINRARGVCETMLAVATNDELRRSVVKLNGFEPYFERMAAHFDVSVDDAARNDYWNAYWFWLHWGQYSSTTDPKDLEDLKVVIYPYADMPGLKYSWEHSYMAKPCLDKEFIDFVETTLATYAQDNPAAARDVSK